MPWIRRIMSEAEGSLGFNVLPLTLLLTGLAVIGIAPTHGASDSAAPEPRPLTEDVAADEPRVARPDMRGKRGGQGEARAGLWHGDGYRVAAVRNGARVRVYGKPGGDHLATVSDKTEFGSPQVFSVLGREGRWLEVATPVSERNDPLWIRANPKGLEFLTTDVSVHASLSERLVELRRDGKVEQRFTVTIGAPGSSTPPGRFAITDVIVGGLNPAYGCCAIVVSAHQLDLPPGWIGGDRIAIHGGTGPVGNASSAGCLRAPNEQAQALGAAVPLGTPVFIRA